MIMYRWRSFARGLLVAGACALAGCSDGDDDVETGPGGAGGPDNGSADTSARLKTLDSDDAFFSAWRDALAGEYDRYGVSNGSVDDADADVAGVTNAPTAPPSSAEAAGDATGDGGAGGGDFTTTNVQEQGVDEADLVKNDGEFLYVLQQGFIDCEACDGPGGDAEPVDSPLAADEEPGVGPGARQQTLLRILSLQPEVPDATSVADVTVPVQGYARGMFLRREGEARSVLVTASDFGGYQDSWNYSAGYAGQRGSVAQLDVTDPQRRDEPVTLAFDGQIISSRLIGDSLVLALRYYPDIEGLDPYAYPSDAEYEAALADIDLSNELPTYARVSDGASVPLVAPSACFVSAEVGESNRWPDIITLAVFDADDLSLESSACYLGASETLYASPEAIFLATTRYRYDNTFFAPEPIDGEDGSVPVAYADPRIDTDIHQFDLSDGQLQYAGSGRVSGHLGWNELRKPFRMSEYGGDLRVVTMSDNQDGSVSPVNLSVLRADGAGTLQTIARLPNAGQPAFIGKPGEQLYASRFSGPRGYLVTYRATDPLYILDLADPAEPKLAGELEVDGYSEYLHPIDDDHLLGIGMDAVVVPGANGDGRDGGVVQGVKVSLYDVSDPTAPTEVDTLLLGQRGSYSSALYDHRAIAILPPGNGRDVTRVAFGIDIAGTPEPARRPPADDAFTYYDWRLNALHGIEVRTGDDAGLALVGRMEAASIDDPGNGYGYGYGGERAVMVGDATYYVYRFGVRAADWNALDVTAPIR